jgi:methyl-accepting chemotaxis protein
MNWSRLQIATRLSVSMGLMAAMVVAMAILAWLLINGMAARQHQVSQQSLPAIERAASFEGHLLRFRAIQTQHVLQQDKAAKDAAQAELDKLLKALDEGLKAYAELPQLDSGAREQVEQVKTGWTAYQQLHAEVMQKSAMWATEEAMSQLNGKGLEAMNALLALLSQLNQSNFDAARSAGQQADAAAQMARGVTLAVGAFALVTAALLAVLLTRSVVAPLREAVEAANRIAQGNLTGTIRRFSNDEVGQLLEALTRMQHKLLDIVHGVRSHSQGVATASEQVAQGNETLSQRTERQADVLQQTTHTMQQLGQAVELNVENAQRAQALATSARTVAQRGGEVVGQMVETMSGINGSSKKIADIIGTIDGIAFQTNILALNAAVEAARAGEQGRGFAVVAAEVRQLAQRSAAAAREINGLISASVTEVDSGTALVGRAGQTMSEVVASVQEVAQLITDINAASERQHQGVVAMGQQVAEMGQVVQQNNSLVEQSNDAAHSLQLQAADLVKAVAAFQVVRHEGQGQLG